MVTWKKLITESLENNKETWGDVESMSPKLGTWLDYLFDDDSESIEGVPFTIWTKKYIYFPVCYDGSEWVGSVSRHPDNKPTYHQGG